MVLGCSIDFGIFEQTGLDLEVLLKDISKLFIWVEMENTHPFCLIFLFELNHPIKIKYVLVVFKF